MISSSVRESPRLRQRLPLRPRRRTSTDVALDALAREMCDRHTGIGADGLIVYEPTPDGASMRLFNADGSRAEVSGNGVRGAGGAAAAGRRPRADVDDRRSRPKAGVKRLTRTARDGDASDVSRGDGAAGAICGRTSHRRSAASRCSVVVLNIGNPQASSSGRCPTTQRFAAAGRGARASRRCFRRGTNVEFAHVEAPDARAHPDLGARRRSDARRRAPDRARRWSRRRRSAARTATPTSSRRAARSASSGATTAST